MNEQYLKFNCQQFVRRRIPADGENGKEEKWCCTKTAAGESFDVNNNISNICRCQSSENIGSVVVDDCNQLLKCRVMKRKNVVDRRNGANSKAKVIENGAYLGENRTKQQAFLRCYVKK